MPRPRRLRPRQPYLDDPPAAATVEEIAEFVNEMGAGDARSVRKGPVKHTFCALFVFLLGAICMGSAYALATGLVAENPMPELTTAFIVGGIVAFIPGVILLLC